ncbi:MBL fold metallo-hydrolase [Thermococcus sp. SY098]|uniref:MBL fold metallo-hydrolase n=1 Tax=Thermococcus sp. SY098 TaxID=3111325 RepID=UPI002D781070|nr:MBL fold metallo-hydrolase [Thermococcus sp. SY098]WRS52306.1 MBL fold metallo-hydrolase [Thermococcus sp. SY098]
MTGDEQEELGVILYFIGTAASEGIPNPLCKCSTCQEARKFAFAQRKPPTLAVLLKRGGVVLFDVGSDIGEHLPGVSIRTVFLTHWHNDHTYGLYKLRWVAKKLSLYAPREGADTTILNEPRNLEIHFIKAGDTIKLPPLKITALKLNHFPETLGYLLESKKKKVAILYDTKGLPEETYELLKKKKPKVALVDATYPPGVEMPTHNNVDEAALLGLSVAEKVYLTHIAHHNLPFTKLLEYVIEKYGEKVNVAYDGMVVYV